MTKVSNMETPAWDISPLTHVIQSTAWISRISLPLFPHLPSRISYEKQLFTIITTNISILEKISWHHIDAFDSLFYSYKSSNAPIQTIGSLIFHASSIFFKTKYIMLKKKKNWQFRNQRHLWILLRKLQFPIIATRISKVFFVNNLIVYIEMEINFCTSLILDYFSSLK